MRAFVAMVASTAVLFAGCISIAVPPAPATSDVHELPVESPLVAANWPIQLTPGPECTGMLQDPESVAADVYARIQGQQDVRQVLAALMPCLGVPVLSSETDDATVLAFLQGKYPGVLDFELDAVVAGLTDGVLVDLDSFIADLADQGFVASVSGEPLTRAAFDEGIVRIAAASDGTGVVPGLLLALGKERAERGRVYVADTTWGDASLDPLQFLLLGLGLPAVERVSSGAVDLGQGRASAALAMAGQSMQRSASLAYGRSVAQMDAGAFVDWLALIMDRGLNVAFPGALDAQAFNLCTMAWAGSARVHLQAVPGVVWHRNGRQPDRADMVGRLTFDAEYGTRISAILGLAGCPPPPTGGMSGKTVEWKRSSGAQKHGSLADQKTVTGDDGTVTASYLTVAETAAEADQIPENEKGEGVEVTLQVLDLLAAFPRTLMVQRTIFGTAVPPGGSVNPSDAVHIAVNWYERSLYTAQLKVDIRIVGTTVLGTAVVKGTIPLTFGPSPTSPTVGLELTGMDVGDLEWTTTGNVVECGEDTVEGSGKLSVYIPGGTVNAIMSDARIRFVPDATADDETMIIPPCPRDDFEGFEYEGWAWWTGLFTASHLADMNPSGGMEITGWSFGAADPTTGVIEAQRTYAEECADECTGQSTFTLTLTPVK